MEKTAVEWLQEKYNSRQVYEESIFDEEFEQAKAMEKEQIIDAFNSGLEYDYDESETYYNKTYTNGL